jgi:O-antigen ligase
MIGESLRGHGRFGATWLLIASMPALFALCSWAASMGSVEFLWTVNRYSIPIVAIEILVICLSITGGFRPVRILAGLPIGARTALAMLVALIWATALFCAPDRPAALIGAYCSTIHLLFGLAVYALRRDSGSIPPETIWRLLLCGHLIFLVIIAFFVFAMWSEPDFDWVKFKVAGSNIRHLGYYSAIGSMLALGLASTAATRLPRAGYVAAAALFLGLSFWTGSRGAIVAALAALPICALISPIFRRPRALLIWLVSLLAGAMLAAPLPVPASNFGTQRVIASAANAEADADALSSGRVTMWRGTILKIKERPFFGYGESQFRSQVPEARSASNHPHNAPLQILLQWGATGLLLLVILGGMLAPRIYRVVQTAPAVTAPAIGVIASVLVFSLYDGTLYYPYPIAMLAVSIAVILGDRRGDEVQAGTRPR